MKTYYHIEEFDPDLNFWEDTDYIFQDKESALAALHYWRSAWSGKDYKFRLIKKTSEILDV